MDKKIIIAISIVTLMITIGFSDLVSYNYQNGISSNEPFISTSATGVNNTNLHKLGPYGHYYWGLGSPVKSVKLWTPVILLNSPYKGCASASSGQSFKVQYDMSGFQSCTETTTTTCLSGIKNGEAVAWAGLATWTIYPVVLKYSSSGGGCPGPKPANYVAEITSPAPASEYTLHTLSAPGSKSDCYEPSSFTKKGYSSVFFCNGFNPSTWKDKSPNMEILSGAAGNVSFTTSYIHEEVISFGIQVVISGTSCFLPGTLNLISTVGTWCWGTFSYHYNSFTYKIPTNSGGKYEFHALSTGSSKDMAYTIRWIKC